MRSSLCLQAGCSQSLFLRLEARAILDVQEVEGPMGRRELRFSMIESDSFKVLPCCARSITYFAPHIVVFEPSHSAEASQK